MSCLLSGDCHYLFRLINYKCGIKTFVCINHISLALCRTCLSLLGVLDAYFYNFTVPLKYYCAVLIFLIIVYVAIIIQRCFPQRRSFFHVVDIKTEK
jgi:hypothetical protein